MAKKEEITMILNLDRIKFTDNSTIGILYVDGKFQCYTLEDCMREVENQHVSNWKIQGKTAIPRGSYKVILDYSNRFKKELPRLLNVPGFEGVRIHAGNTQHDTEGCVLVGTAMGEDRVNNSRIAFNQLMELLDKAYDNGEQITIEIK